MEHKTKGIIKEKAERIEENRRELNEQGGKETKMVVRTKYVVNSQH
jgi:uncharacterized protein with GYD domain